MQKPDPEITGSGIHKRHRAGKKRKTIHVDVVSAEGMVFAGPAHMLAVPTVMGEVGILPGHSPLLARLKPGEIRIDVPEQEEMLIYVSGGIMEVQPSMVTVLSDTALRAEAIDEADAIAARRRAEAAMLQQNKPNFDYAKAQNELAKAAAQLRALEDSKKHARKRSNQGRAPDVVGNRK